MLFVISCSNNIDRDIPVVNIDINNLCDAEDIFEDYSYVALETNDECILSNISKLEINESGIYILDDRRAEIQRYDLKGSFLNKVNKKGRSREEYVSITDFNVSGNNIYVLSRAEKKINVYNAFNSRYMYTIQLNDWYNNLIVVEDIIYLYSERSNNQGKDFIVYDITKERYVNSFDKFVISESYGFRTTPFSCNSDGRLFVTKPFDSQVYELTKRSFSTHYAFNFNISIKPKINNSTRYSEVSSQYKYKSIIKRILHFSRSDDNMRLITRLFLDGKGDRSLLSIVDSKGQVKSYCYGDKISDKFPYLHAPIYMKDNIVVSATPVSSVLNGEKEFNRGLFNVNEFSEYDNPILLFVKVKRF